MEASSRRGGTNKLQLSLPVSTSTDLLTVHVWSADGSPVATVLKVRHPYPETVSQGRSLRPSSLFLRPRNGRCRHDYYHPARRPSCASRRYGRGNAGLQREAVHLNRHEGRLVTVITRRALDENVFHCMPLVVGCGSAGRRARARRYSTAEKCGRPGVTVRLFCRHLTTRRSPRRRQRQL